MLKFRVTADPPAHLLNVGMSFSEKIFEVISTGLVARKAVQMLYSKRK